MIWGAIEVIYGAPRYEFLYGSSLLFRLDAVILQDYTLQLLTAIKLLVKSGAQEMASIASKFERYINHHFRKEMMRERVKTYKFDIFLSHFYLYFLS